MCVHACVRLCVCVCVCVMCLLAVCLYLCVSPLLCVLSLVLLPVIHCLYHCLHHLQHYCTSGIRSFTNRLSVHVQRRPKSVMLSNSASVTVQSAWYSQQCWGKTLSETLNLTEPYTFCTVIHLQSCTPDVQQCSWGLCQLHIIFLTVYTVWPCGSALMLVGCYLVVALIFFNWYCCHGSWLLGSNERPLLYVSQTEPKHVLLLILWS